MRRATLSILSVNVGFVKCAQLGRWKRLYTNNTNETEFHESFYHSSWKFVQFVYQSAVSGRFLILDLCISRSYDTISVGLLDSGLAGKAGSDA